MPVQISGLGVLSDEDYFAISPKDDYNLILDLPNGGQLFMGETPSNEDLWLNPALKMLDSADRGRSLLVTPDFFDVRVDLYGHNLRAHEEVVEYLIPLYDNDISTWGADEFLDLEDAVFYAFDGLARGERVLVNCQAGLNRSGLVTALVLIAYGMGAPQAIQTIRERRAELCLANRAFVDYLYENGTEFAKRVLKDD